MRSLPFVCRTMVSLLAFTVIAASQSSAQNPAPLQAGQVAAASMDQIVQFVTATAYRGITLSDEQRTRVREIIMVSRQEQQRLDTRRADFIDRRQVVLDRRNAAMRALLTSDRDRKQFDENIPELQP